MSILISSINSAFKYNISAVNVQSIIFLGNVVQVICLLESIILYIATILFWGGGGGGREEASEDYNGVNSINLYFDNEFPWLLCCLFLPFRMFW